jgi:hypothetical protein
MLADAICSLNIGLTVLAIARLMTVSVRGIVPPRESTIPITPAISTADPKHI